MSLYFYIIGASLLTSLISLVGVLVLVISQKSLRWAIMFLVSLSAGTLLGDAFIHLLPGALLGRLDSSLVWLMVIVGILLFFILEKIIHWRHCHVSPDVSHPHPVGLMNLVGDGFHNLLDGFLIGASFLVSIPLGITTTLAVIVHEIPQELGDFGTLLYAGYNKWRAIWLNLLSGLLSVIGAIAALFIGLQNQKFVDFIIPLTAGGFIYIATSDLIPELKKDSKLADTLRQLIGIIIGLLIMLILKKYD
jgi:zinc and cadmium transporter